MAFPQAAVPPMARIRQALSNEHIKNVRGELKERLLESGQLDGVKAGDKIAVTAGSRGMGGFVELLKGIVDAVKSKGGEPFILPAMGSHG